MRVQWDPERSLLLERLDHRAVQIGLADDAARRYVNEWTVDITDITALAHEIQKLVEARDLTTASEKLPAECAYPLPDDLKAIIGAT